MYGGLVGMRQGLIAPFQVRGAAGSSWSPVDLGAALRLWLKADVGITLNGSDVAAWADQSGNGFNLVQATAAQQPAYNATGFNGRPTVDFVESDTNNLQSAHNVAFSLGTASSWFIVGQMHPETGIYGRLIVYVEATQADTGSSSDYDYFTNVAAILRDNTNNSISGYFSAVQKLCLGRHEPYALCEQCCGYFGCGGNALRRQWQHKSWSESRIFLGHSNCGRRRLGWGHF
jgi:hypothetical protein